MSACLWQLSVAISSSHPGIHVFPTEFNNQSSVVTVLTLISDLQRRTIIKMVKKPGTSFPIFFFFQSASERYIFWTLPRLVTRSWIINPLYHFNFPEPLDAFFCGIPRLLWDFNFFWCRPLIGASFAQQGNQIVRAISNPFEFNAESIFTAQWSNIINLASSNFFFLHHYYLSSLKLITIYISLISIHIHWKNHMALLIYSPFLCSSHCP